MKKKYIIIAVIIVALFTIGLFLFNNKTKTYKINKNFTRVEARNNNENIDDNIVFTNYQDYLKYFNGGKLTEKDFIGFNYVLVKISYNPCGEEDITPYKYDVNGNAITVYVSYNAKCGGCQPEYLYYLLKVEKTITKASVNIEYEVANDANCPSDVAYKPIIYLYPEKVTDINISLGNANYLTTTYPKYNGSWNVVAFPDGRLIDKNTNREYYGLYWEGNNHSSKIEKDGFVIKGENTISFLEDKLMILGLTDREADEFIIYWLPKLEHNKYNYIRFEKVEEINNYMPLNINPKPDNIIRILMDYKPLDKKIEVKEQTLTTPNRSGFVVVEWGGSLIN